MNYISNFFKLLFNNLFSTFGSIAPSSLSSTTNLTATETFVDAIDEVDDNPLLGTAMTTTASAVTGAANQAYDEASQYNMKASQSYVQSLSENELNTFIAKLEDYQIEDITALSSNETPKVLSKTMKPKNKI